MKRYIAIFMMLATMLVASCNTDSYSDYRVVDGVIYYNTPQRAEGQQDMLNFAAEPMEVVRVGFIGLGMRGPGAVRRWCQIEGTEIVALCDINTEGIEKSQKYIAAAGRKPAAEYSGSEDAWQKVCERDDIDLIYIMTDWKNHAQMALYAMECGKHVAIEVPAAMNMAEIWALI